MKGPSISHPVNNKSSNCLGRRVTSCTTRDANEIAKLPAMLPLALPTAQTLAKWAFRGACPSSFPPRTKSQSGHFLPRFPLVFANFAKTPH